MNNKKQNNEDIKTKINLLSKSFGFDVCKITKPEIPNKIQKKFQKFLKNKLYGEMDWLKKTEYRRKSPINLWSEAKSAIVLGLNYGPKDNPFLKNKKNDLGNISVYANGEDYHKVFKGKLKRFASKLFPILNKDKQLDLKVFVDTAPLLEKPLAQLAGLGWQGKHTNLVSKEFGSWLFLGVILLNKEVPVDFPENDHCGSCKACLDICPTEAFIAPYEIDPRKCISYLTIEYSGKISEVFMEKMGNRIYGCDDCLAICPWNKFAKLSSEIKFYEIDKEFSLDILLSLDEFNFKKKFARSPIQRIGRERFIRNCCIAAGNSKNKIYKKQLKYLLDNEKSEIILYAANWANNRLV